MNQVAVQNTVVPMRARDYSGPQLALIQRTVAADCEPTEFNLFMEVARRVGLDPFRRQIYAVVYNKDKPKKRRMSIITGIDGFRAVAARGGDYRPDENEPEITYDATLKNPETNPLGIVKAVVRCFKFGPDKQWHPVVGVAYWDEFAPLKEKMNKVDTGETWPNGDKKYDLVGTGVFTLSADSKWRTMARVMLPKCAEAQAIRKGWPEDLSGIYAPEEMARAEVIDVTATEVIEEHAKEERLKLVGAKDGIAICWTPGGALEMVPIGKMTDRAMEFFARATNEADIQGWAQTNRVSLQRYWAEHKADALGIKTAMEKRVKELSSTAPTRATAAADQTEAQPS
jgi:phage recombination protein Bet